MPTALVIHGHFYQPPRENPWTGELERETSARPFHDWNERILAECYRPNAYARIFDSRGHVERIGNNYSKLSFNFGPTLLSWLAKHDPHTYDKIIAADVESTRLHRGHGNAIAQGYNHAIMPLCNERDRRTQVRWGIEDFRWRFGRFPESLWLPETACDASTLETLIDEGLKFVILSPYQALRVRVAGGDLWTDVADGTIDPSVPYAFYHRDGSRRSIAIFFYDGGIAKGIAFERLLASSASLVDAFERSARGRAPLVHAATDGESYGHHYRFGDLCLAHALEIEARRRGFEVTNYGTFLEQNPPEFEVELKTGLRGEGTAWSCAHGLGRWSRDCGCATGAHPGWHQSWRQPLRAALDLLRDDAAKTFEATAGDIFVDPWSTRDRYITQILDPLASIDEFLQSEASRKLHSTDFEIARGLLEVQRASMTMYTSCGWFFDDISGLEAVQVLRYAGRVISLMEELKLDPPTNKFVEQLAEAKSNIPAQGTGADIFKRAVGAAPSARRHSHRAERPGVRSVFEASLTSALRSFLLTPNVEDYYSALSLISLGKKLRLHASLDRAQEIIYEALHETPITDELRELASRLGLAESLFSRDVVIPEMRNRDALAQPPQS